jgi:hypothetical protein
LICDVLCGPDVILFDQFSFSGRDVVSVHIVKLGITVVNAYQHVFRKLWTELKNLSVDIVIRSQITFRPAAEFYAVDVPVLVTVPVLNVENVVVGVCPVI